VRFVFVFENRVGAVLLFRRRFSNTTPRHLAVVCGLWSVRWPLGGAVTLLPLRRPHARKNELLPDMNQQTYGDGTTQQNPASRL
jgi:hypothetical protein